MLKPANEAVLSRIIAVGTTFTTILIISGSVTDPVNVTKLLSLGVTATAALGVLVAGYNAGILKSGKTIWVACVAFLLFSLISVLASASPVSQGIYGSYGRNNGFLTYAFLILA